jgi:DNA modification methylase
VAFALQADGWYLRSDIIWAKPNPMPESIKDRPTRAHEYVFLLSKNRRYYWDQIAIREDFSSKDEHKKRKTIYQAHGSSETSKGRGNGHNMLGDPGRGRNIRSVWTISTKSYRGAHFAVFPEDLVKPCIKAGAPINGIVLDPFCGSGTVLAVAQGLNRKGIGIELNPEYCDLAVKRLGNQSSLPFKPATP